MPDLKCYDYVVGEQPRFPAHFRLGAVFTDPTTIKFIFQRPGDASPTVYLYGTNPELVREAPGKYYVDLFLNIEGQWAWRFESTGTVVSAKQGTFLVAAENPIG
jgi:hypothetical protein